MIFRKNLMNKNEKMQSRYYLTLFGAGGTGGLVLVQGGGMKNTPPQNLKINGSEAQHF